MVKDLVGTNLNYWTAKAVGYRTSTKGGEVLLIDRHRDKVMIKKTTGKAPCEYEEKILDFTNWSQCGELIERYKPDITYADDEKTITVTVWVNGEPFGCTGDNLKGCLCRAIIASVYGECVEDKS